VQLNRIRVAIGVLATLIAALVPGQAQKAVQSHAVLVELFTSEGCSSCPPADALLRQLNGKSISSGQLIVGISEHVTYWNSLGWTDPFSASAYTDRQNSYGSRFHLDSVYTPQIVVNGEQQVLGSDSNAVLRAVRETDHPGQLAVHIISTAVTGGSLVVTYSINGSASGHSADLFAVLVDDVVQSNVKRGENSGRNLVHVSVARSITRIATVKDFPAAETTARLPLGADPHSSARHLVLFAQSAHLGPVLSVDTVALQ
jgi:hypothetical protein